MVKLTPKQQQIYDYILSFTSQHGYPPSVREIGAAVGLKSPSTVHFHMKGLEEAGVIVKAEGKPRAITIPARIDFMATSSYGSGVKTSGVVKIVKDLDLELKGYDILIVEDILDSGRTLSYLMELLQARGPKSIQICTLFDKPDRREVEVRPTYVGAQIPDAFIVGYGLDYDEKYRNLPFVGVLKPSVYE